MGKADDAANQRRERQQQLSDLRRARILDAAKTAFQEHGLEGASLREIARRAGYAPSALYFYYRNKEDIYGDLLADSLERLNADVAAAASTAGDAPDARLRASALGFFRFYSTQPRDLELGFYLFRGMGPHGLNQQLDNALNERLLDAFQPMAVALEAMGLSTHERKQEIAALFGHCVGLLVLQHTKRMNLFGQTAEDLFSDYLDRLCERADFKSVPCVP